LVTPVALPPGWLRLATWERKRLLRARIADTIVQASTERDIEATFASWARLGVGALVVLPNAAMREPDRARHHEQAAARPRAKTRAWYVGHSARHGHG